MKIRGKLVQLSFYSLLIFPLVSAFSQTGSIKGVIADAKTKETLVAATVMIEGTSGKGAVADLDGNYVIQNLARGTYSLKVSYVAYLPLVVKDVVVESSKETVLNILLEPDDVSLDEVVVLATSRKESEQVLLLDQRNATGIRESVGARQLSLQGVSDAATATTKISGVVKSEGSGEVFVRGLGDRYISTTMNDLPIPSDDVDRKNIDLGLLPTQVIQNVGISKTSNAGSYIDQSGGNINIVSKEFIDQFSVEWQTGLNTSVWSDGIFRNFKSSPNVSNSFLSFYNRQYSLVDAVTKQSWDSRNSRLPVDFGLSATGGEEFEWADARLSLFYTLSYKSDYTHSNGVYRRFNSNTLYSDFSDTESWTSNENLTGLVNLAYRWNPRHKLSYNFLLVNKLTDNVYEQGRNGNGYKFDMDEISNSFFTRDMNTRTTRLLVNQLLGSHRFSDANRVEWGIGFSKVASDEPNRIRTYTGFNNQSLYFSYRISDFDNRKSSQAIDDTELNGYVRNSLDFSLGNHSYNLTYGLNFRNKQRDFSNRFVGVQLMGVRKEDGNVDDMTSIFTSPAFEVHKIKTIPDDLYDARLEVLAGFATLDFDYGAFEGNIGVRYEYDLMNVQWDINNDDPLREPKMEKSKAEFYPSLNLRYVLNDSHSLRFSGSKTITLPEFKEIAPFAYTSPNSTMIQGSPELKSSENLNVDLKWEYYKAKDELLSIAAFYKSINDPINITSLTGGAGYLIYANTGKKAQVFGIEAEARLNLYKSESHIVRTLVNGTKMWVEQDLLEAYQYNQKTTSGLQGASELAANLSVHYENTRHHWVASLSGAYSSDRIFALGSPKDTVNRDYLYNDEIIEEGFITLDAVFSKDITDKLSLRLVAKNLLNPEIRMTQNVRDLNSREESNYVVESYKKGTKLQLSLTYTF